MTTDPLERAREEAQERVAALRRTRDEIVAAAEGANTDDEHDPEGATIAFEREQVSALLRQAEASVAASEAALVRRERGDYGRCTSCGGDIGAERLEARPHTEHCIACAR